jgi:hypothetical protein
MPFVIQNPDGTFVGRRHKTRFGSDTPSRQKDLQRATVWKKESECAIQHAMPGARIRAVELTLVPVQEPLL